MKVAVAECVLNIVTEPIEELQAPFCNELPFFLSSSKSERGHKFCKLCEVLVWLLTLISAELPWFFINKPASKAFRPEPHRQVLKSVELKP